MVKGGSLLNMGVGDAQLNIHGDNQFFKKNIQNKLFIFNEILHGTPGNYSTILKKLNYVFIYQFQSCQAQLLH